jgi:hypothetical protein
MKQLCVAGPLPDFAPKVEAVLAAFKVRLNYTLYSKLWTGMSGCFLWERWAEQIVVRSSELCT